MGRFGTSSLCPDARSRRSTVVVGALLAGVSGFGLGIVAVPLVLLAAFPLPFVVTAVRLIALATRVSVTWRLRQSNINHRHAAVLTITAVPGLFVGALFLRLPTAMAFGSSWARVLLWRGRCTPLLGSRRHPRNLNLAYRRSPSAPAHPSRHPHATFLADLGTYFVVTPTIGLGVLSSSASSARTARSIPLVATGSWRGQPRGTSMALQLPQTTVRSLFLMLAFVAGLGVRCCRSQRPNR